jgi:hypothetical protein
VQSTSENLKRKMPVSSRTRVILPQNLSYTSVTEHTASMSPSIGIRVYSNTNPKIRRTSELQKGLIFVCDDAETIGEATGFGVPIIKSSDETYFSGSSSVYMQRARREPPIRRFPRKVRISEHTSVHSSERRRWQSQKTSRCVFSVWTHRR